MTSWATVSYPTLRLEEIPAWRRIFAAIAFLPEAWRAIEQRRLAPRYSHHFVDANSAPLGLASGDVQYPIREEDVRLLAPLILELEDRRFFRHKGIDARAVLRAMVANIRSGRVTQGGGTITQQLVRNTLLTPHSSLLRKILEISLAVKLERHYSKVEIIRRYCELVYLGGGVRGFAAAARAIYRKNLSDLSFRDHCGVVGLLRTPGRTYPTRDSKRFEQRQEFVAGVLATTLSGPMGNASSKPVNPIKLQGLKRPRLTSIVRSELNRIGYPSTSVTRVELFLDRSTQDALDRSAKEVSQFPSIKAVAGIVLDLSSGTVVAETAWGRGQQMEFSPAFFGRIQPGSTFKTFAALAAFEQGWRKEDTFESAPFESELFRGVRDRWRVRTFRDEYRGRISLEDAFAHSDNTVFARLVEQLDLGGLYDVYSRFHLASPKYLTPSVVLGALPGGLNLLALASAYRTIAANGWWIRPRIIKRVSAPNRDHQWIHDRWAATRLLDQSTAVAVRELLENAGKLFSGVFFAGKTGTTRTGNLFAGYNGHMAAALWVGYERRQSEFERKGGGALDLMEGFVGRLLGHKSSFLGIG